MEHLRINAVIPHRGYLILHLCTYPAWHVRVNGRLISNLPQRNDGLMAVPVPRGPVDLTVDWTTTPDVIVGRWITMIAVLFLIALVAWDRKQRPARL